MNLVEKKRKRQQLSIVDQLKICKLAKKIKEKKIK